MKPSLSRLIVDVLLWASMVVPLFIATDPLPAGSPLSGGQLRLVGMVVFALALVVARWAPFVGALLPLLLTAVVSTGVYVQQLLLAQIVMAFLLGRRTAGRSAAGQVLALVGVTAVVHLARGDADWLQVVNGLVLQVVFAWAVGQFLRQQADLAATGFELAQRLEQEQTLAIARERSQERSRIAGDMHDSLGHDLALLAVKAGAVQVSPGATPEVRRAAAELRESAAAATARLRQIIGVLREGDAPMVPHTESIRALVDRAAGHGLHVTLREVGSESDGSDAERAARRVVQEALTNAAKHAPGARVSVEVVRTADMTEARVDNPLPNDAADRPAPGYGLVGLDERVRLAGGTLEAGDRDGIFTVHAWLPATAEGHLPPSSAPVAHRALADARQQFRRGLALTSAIPVVLTVLVLVTLLLTD